MPWSRAFEDPVPCRQLVTLDDAAAYIIKLPKAGRVLINPVQAAHSRPKATDYCGAAMRCAQFDDELAIEKSRVVS
jgi:hypothetical protein